MSQILKITKKEELIKPLISDPLDEEKWIQNEQILRELEAEEKRLMTAYGIAGFLTVAPIITPLTSFVSIPAVAAAGITAEYLTRVNRLYRVTKMLLDKFGQVGITITMRVKTTAGWIDLLVRMSGKRNFALLLRSNGDAKVRWREDKQQFTIYKPGKDAKRWDAMTRTAERLKGVLELKDIKSKLIGTSRTDRDRPITRVVVLCGKTKIYPGHESDLVEFGRAKALKVYKESLFYVVEEDNLVDFLSQAEKK